LIKDLETKMPAVLSYATIGAAAAWSSLAKAAAFGARLGAGLGRAVRNRRAAAGLAGLDDHMLADIGLTRSDLRDAYAEPLWHDPTDLLASRAAERRGRQSIWAEAPKLPWLSCETAACK
jgi:uncharacterized protein YjiS (DUF1127 family)